MIDISLRFDLMERKATKQLTFVPLGVHEDEAVFMLRSSHSHNLEKRPVPVLFTKCHVSIYGAGQFPSLAALVLLGAYS